MELQIQSNLLILQEAAKVLRMLSDGAFFADIKAELDQSVKTRQDAYMLLDGIESLVGDIVRGTSDLKMEPDQVMECTQLIEETRHYIKLGAGYNYRIRGLVLRLGEKINGRSSRR